MNFLHEMQRWVGYRAQGPTAEQVTEETQKAARLLAPLFWRWFRTVKDEQVISRRVLGLFSVTIYWRDLSFAFERVFGPQIGA